MADRINLTTPTPTEAAPSVTSLVGGIVSDLQTLIRHEVTLARTEMKQEWEKTKTAASSMAFGAGLLTLAGILFSFTLVYLLLALVPALPEWADFGIVAVAFALVGGILMAAGRSQASEVNVIPPKTAQTMKENVQWIQNQT